jgi:hypothetical protein
MRSSIEIEREPGGRPCSEVQWFASRARNHRAEDADPTTPEEHQRRGDAADALFREMKRRIAATKERRG